MTSVFSHGDYKEYLSRVIADHPRGQVSRLAEAAGCQRSYLSNVLRTHIHLVPDQLFGIARFLGIDARETDYLMMLLEKERSGSPAYRRHLGEKIAALRRSREDLAQRLSREPLQSEADQLTYYSAWYYAAIHILVSIPNYQSVEKIAAILALDKTTVQTALRELEKMGLVAHAGTHWRFLSGDIHVPKSSPLVSLHHNNWRSRAVLHAQSRAEGTHFTMVQAVSRKVAADMRERVLAMVDELSRMAGPSDSEELVYFGLDEFRLT